MQIHKALMQHLERAALLLSESDRAEMELIGPGRDPVEVITAVADDPDAMCITDEEGNVLAVGGSPAPFIWFVHTETATLLTFREKVRMLRLLVKYLTEIKRKAIQAQPDANIHFTNAVSAQNAPHIKLLNFLGAKWSQTPLHINGHEFRQFFF